MKRSTKQKKKAATGSSPRPVKASLDKSAPATPIIEGEIVDTTVPTAGLEKVTHALVKRQESTLQHGSLELYLAEINRFPILTKDEEYALALYYWKTGDPQAAHKLVTANLRFVVKIALQYSKYGIKLKDLIQEGNIGLMMAVKKYNPNLGYRLISYAVWWIKAYIQKHLLDTWSMVRIGTTQAQRKLFSSLKRIQQKLRSIDGTEPTDLKLAEALDVREEDVREMKLRLQGQDISLDAPLDEESGATRLDFIPSSLEEADEQLIRKGDQQLMQKAISIVRKKLNDKEAMILQRRLLADEPATLEEIGQTMSVSRERVRQIEENLKKKLRETVKQLMSVEDAS